jgi:hypothetical protein
VDAWRAMHFEAAGDRHPFKARQARPSDSKRSSRAD